MKHHWPLVKIAVYKRINEGVAHGQPVESQEDVMDVIIFYDCLVDVNCNEVAMIRQPADGKKYHHYNEHSHDLCKKSNKLSGFWF